jgi:preprotein translocase subunit SecE
VARDRKRAKQRRERRAHAARTASSASPIERADVPGALDHASSDVDEFDAAIVRGAGGLTATPETDTPLEAPEADLPDDSARGAQDELELPAGPPGGGNGSRGGGGAGGGGHGGGGGGGDLERPSGAPLRGGNRAVGFIRASWAELQRVQWPDRRQVTQATAVVLGFVAIAGAYLGLADYVAKEIVEFIL